MKYLYRRLETEWTREMSNPYCAVKNCFVCPCWDTRENFVSIHTFIWQNVSECSGLAPC